MGKPPELKPREDRSNITEKDIIITGKTIKTDGDAVDDQDGRSKNLGDRLSELTQQLEKFNLAEYMNQLNNPRRYLMVNFLGGLFRGLGMAIGLTIFGALILYVLQRLVVLNLPVIGDFLAELVRIVLTYL